MPSSFFKKTTPLNVNALLDLVSEKPSGEIDVPFSPNPNDTLLTAKHMPRLRENAARYFEAAALLKEADGCSTDVHGDMEKICGYIRSSELFYSSGDMVELAINVLNTTGIQKDWVDMLPDNILLMLDKPIGTVSGTESFVPMVAYEDVQVSSSMHTLTRRNFPPSSRTPISGLWVKRMEDGSFMYAPFSSYDQLYSRNEWNLTQFRKFKAKMRRASFPDGMGARIGQYIRSAHMFSKLSSNFLPTMPDGDSVRWELAYDAQCAEMIRCNATQNVYCAEAVSSVVVAFVAALFACAREPSLGDMSTETVARGKGKGGRNRTAADSDVTLISLRRNPAHENPDNEVDDEGRTRKKPDHRWIVRGHFRHVRYGKNHAQSRVQWIAPYVVGDPGLPLAIRQKVNIL